MKRSLFVLAVLSIPALLLAGSYTITTSTVQDNRLERARVRANKATCGALSLPAACTQAQARAKDSNANIYSDVADFMNRSIVGDYIRALKAADTSDDAAQAAEAWAAMSDTQKNAVCTLLGLPAGCEAWAR